MWLGSVFFLFYVGKKCTVWIMANLGTKSLLNMPFLVLLSKIHIYFGHRISCQRAEREMSNQSDLATVDHMPRFRWHAIPPLNWRNDWMTGWRIRRTGEIVGLGSDWLGAVQISWISFGTYKLTPRQNDQGKDRRRKKWRQRSGVTVCRCVIACVFVCACTCVPFLVLRRS